MRTGLRQGHFVRRETLPAAALAGAFAGLFLRREFVRRLDGLNAEHRGRATTGGYEHIYSAWRPGRWVFKVVTWKSR